MTWGLIAGGVEAVCSPCGFRAWRGNDRRPRANLDRSPNLRACRWGRLPEALDKLNWPLDGSKEAATVVNRHL